MDNFKGGNKINLQDSSSRLNVNKVNASDLNTLCDKLDYLISRDGVGWFILTWTATGAESFVQPLHVGSSYDFDWSIDSGVTWTNNTSDALSIPVGGAGDYDIIYRVNGNGLPRLDQTVDALKISKIKQWGSNKWESWENLFYGCQNLVGEYTDLPNTSLCTTVKQAFRNCYVFNSSLDGIDTSNVIVFASMFRDARLFNQSLISFDTSNGVDLRFMFRSAYVFNQPINHFNMERSTQIDEMLRDARLFDQDISSWVLINAVSANNFMISSTGLQKLSTVNFDLLLDITTGWPRLPLKDGVNIHFGASKYTGGGSNAELGHDKLENTFSWVIIDAGQV